MYLKRTSRPRSVTTANGSILSHSDLPHEDTIRWVASRKAKVVRAVLYGLITEEDALTRYNISLDEFHFPKIWFEASDFSRKRFQLCAAGALNH